MKRTSTIVAIVVAALTVLALPASAGNGALKGTGADGSQVTDYLFNKAGYHFWFTATNPGWGSSSLYVTGNDYHNVYKYEVDDPDDWCPATTTIPDREPYNLGGTAHQTAYYKIWDSTAGMPVCGNFDVVSGDVAFTTASSEAATVKFDINLSSSGYFGETLVVKGANHDYVGDIDCYAQDGTKAVFAGSATGTTAFYRIVVDSDSQTIRVQERSSAQTCDLTLTTLVSYTGTVNFENEN